MSTSFDIPKTTQLNERVHKSDQTSPVVRGGNISDVSEIQVDPKAFVTTKQTVGVELEKSYKQLEAAVEEIRKLANKNLLNLGFSIDRKINTHVVVVTDQTTGEVIRQIPNEVIIRVAHNIADLKGVLFDKKL